MTPSNPRPNGSCPLAVAAARRRRFGSSNSCSPRPPRRPRRPAWPSFGAALRRLGRAGRTVQHADRDASSDSLRERRVRIDAVGLRQRHHRFAHQLAIAARPRRDRAAEQRLRLVRHDEARIEVVGGAEALTVRARAVRRVERERARRHLGHRDAADDAGQPPREQLIAALERVDDDDLVGEVERDLERFREAPLDAGLDDQPIDDDVDGVIAAAIELDVLVERSELAVDARLGEAALAQRLQLLLELALAAADDRRQHVDAGVGRIEHHQIENPLERLRRDLAAAVVAVRHADVGEQQAEVVVDLGDRADRRARVRAGRLLLDGDRRRQALDQVDVRLLHLLEELPGVGRERLDVAPLAFRVDRVEGERGLARAGQAGDDDELIPRQVDVDVLEIVNAGAAHRDPVVRHLSGLY